MPIWFSTHDTTHQPIPFVLLIYQWSKHSLRLDGDPFLSYRVRGQLFCLLHSHIQAAVKSSAAHFGLSATWFNTHSIRMSGPTIARAANLSVPNIMRMGRWKSLPAPILYQEQSTKSYRSLITQHCYFPEFWHRIQGHHQSQRFANIIQESDSMSRCWWG